jgi:hypothetical protein
MAEKKTSKLKLYEIYSKQQRVHVLNYEGKSYRADDHIMMVPFEPTEEAIREFFPGFESIFSVIEKGETD